MSGNNQKQSIWQKIKDTKANRAALAGACVLLTAVAVIISVTVAGNRSKKQEDPLSTKAPSRTEAVTQAPEQKPEQTTQAPQKKPADTGSSQVENKLPSFILPVSGVLSVKHDATQQVYSSTLKDHRVHLGIDIVTSEGASVYAAADGKIDKIWEDPLLGQCIAIAHGGDSYTIYKNLSATLPEGIAQGVSVRAGQLIATVGDTAMIEVAQEPHLHFEMTVADLLVDPLEYFDEQSLETLKLDASHGE